MSKFGTLFAKMTAPFHEALRILSRIDAPIVTAAHGAVAGGGLGYVYAADLVIAAEDTKFVTAFAALGLSGGRRRNVAPAEADRFHARTAEAYLRNRPIEATEALQWGLINEIVPAAELRRPGRGGGAGTGERPHPWLRADACAAAQRMAQRFIRRSCKPRPRRCGYTGDTADATSAINDFAAKRRPEFTGR